MRVFGKTKRGKTKSGGIVNGKPVLDLDYEEDSNAQVDMNLVMTSEGKLIEIQGTAEGEPFSEAELDKLIQQHSRLEEIQGRPAQMGDFAVLEFDGFIDEKPFGDCIVCGKKANNVVYIGKQY